MVYLAGFLGLLCGFCLALLVLSRLLRGYTRNDLLQNKDIRAKYGIMAWAIAGLGAYAGVWLYRFYFPG